MQIALCDDEERQLDLLGGFLRAYEAEHGMDLTLTRFFSGEALLAAPREFSIVFMDFLDFLSPICYFDACGIITNGFRLLYLG